MPVIEGVGDEVLVVVGVFIVLCIILLAWLSTHTREIPLFSIIVVELSQRRQRNNRDRARDGQPAEQSGAETQPSDATPSDSTRAEEAAGTSSHADPGDKEDSTPSSPASSKNSCLQEGAVSETAQDNTSANAAEVKPAASEASPQDMTPEQEQMDGSGMAEAAAEVSTVPPFLPESGAEMRRRRVAYFTGGGGSSTQKDVEQDNDSADEEKTAASPVSSSDTLSSSSPVEASSSAPQPATSSETASSEEPGESPSGGPDAVAKTSASGAVSEGTQSSSQESADPGGQQIRVRLKYLNDTQRLVYTDPQETIGNFRRLHFSSELEEDKAVRFIFKGRDLRNDLSTLQAYNIDDNSVVHCLITQNQPPADSSNSDSDSTSVDNNGDDELQLSVMLFPIFAVALGMIWYLRFTYRQYFNSMSTISLIGISCIYVVAFVSSMRQRRRDNHEHLD